MFSMGFLFQWTIGNGQFIFHCQLSIINCQLKKMNLKLKKPLAFIDIEATGIDVATDRIVELSLLKISVDGKEERLSFRVNPTIPISPQAIAIHHISNDEVKNWQTFKEVAPQAARFLKGCDIAGYNSNKYDIPLLAEEFLRADVDFDFRKVKLVDVQTIFFKMEQRTLSAAYKFYCNKELENAHSAESDANATFEVLKAQLEKYSELQNDVDALAEFSVQNKNVDFAGRIIYNDDGKEVFNFGKHKGQLVDDVLAKEPGFYNWMMKGDFPLYTKKILTILKLRNAYGNVKNM